MKRTGKLTVHDIGRLAGVSGMTVSRALNTPDQVSSETLERVREVVQMTGFVPNQLARSFRSSKAKLVAAILPTLVGPVFQESIGELHRTLEEHGFQLLIAKSGYKSDDREHLIIDALLQRRPDGIVHMGVVEVDSARRLLMNSGIPVVEAWDLTPT